MWFVIFICIQFNLESLAPHSQVEEASSYLGLRTLNREDQDRLVDELIGQVDFDLGRLEDLSIGLVNEIFENQFKKKPSISLANKNTRLIQKEVQAFLDSLEKIKQKVREQQEGRVDEQRLQERIVQHIFPLVQDLIVDAYDVSDWYKKQVKIGFEEDEAYQKNLKVLDQRAEETFKQMLSLLGADDSQVLGRIETANAETWKKVEIFTQYREQKRQATEVWSQDSFFETGFEEKLLTQEQEKELRKKILSQSWSQLTQKGSWNQRIQVLEAEVKNLSDDLEDYFQEVDQLFLKVKELKREIGSASELFFLEIKAQQERRTGKKVEEQELYAFVSLYVRSETEALLNIYLSLIEHMGKIARVYTKYEDYEKDKSYQNHEIAMGAIFDSFIEVLIVFSHQTHETHQWLESKQIESLLLKFIEYNYRFIKARKGIKSDDVVLGQGKTGVVFEEEKDGKKLAVKLSDYHYKEQFDELIESRKKVEEAFPEYPPAEQAEYFQKEGIMTRRNTLIAMEKIEGDLVENYLINKEWSEEELYQYIQYALSVFIRALDKGLIVSDYHPKNVMWNPTTKRFRLIDAEDWGLELEDVEKEGEIKYSIKSGILSPFGLFTNDPDIIIKVINNQAGVPLEFTPFREFIQKVNRLQEKEGVQFSAQLFRKLSEDLKKEWEAYQEQKRKQKEEEGFLNLKTHLKSEETAQEKSLTTFQENSSTSHLMLGLVYPEQEALSEQDKQEFMMRMNTAHQAVCSRIKIGGVKSSFSIVRQNKKIRSLASNVVGMSDAKIVLDERLYHVLNQLSEGQEELEELIIENETRQIQMKQQAFLKGSSLTEEKDENNMSDLDYLEIISWVQTMLSVDRSYFDRKELFQKFLAIAVGVTDQADKQLEQQVFKKVFEYIDLLSLSLASKQFEQVDDFDTAKVLLKQMTDEVSRTEEGKSIQSLSHELHHSVQILVAA